ncbi:MAG: NTP transferase domain-containing protein [Betaproteobacteria bacterium]|nr:NTP transferase domain-containing protein [Betaproteobacteria bacterium]
MARQVDLLACAGLRRIVVVLGRHAAAFEPVLRETQERLPARVRLEWVCNPAPEAGTGASLRCALARLVPEAKHLPPEGEGARQVTLHCEVTEMAAVLVLLADQPLLLDEDIDAALRAWQSRAPDIELVMPTYQGQPGHPLVFGRTLWRWLVRQPAFKGVRDWRDTHPTQVQALPVTHPRCTLDIDTEADLAALAAIHGVYLRWPDAQQPSLVDR